MNTKQELPWLAIAVLAALMAVGYSKATQSNVTPAYSPAPGVQSQDTAGY